MIWFIPLGGLQIMDAVEDVREVDVKTLQDMQARPC